MMRHKVLVLLCAVLIALPFWGVRMAQAANTLTVSLDSTLVTGPIPAGAPRYIFAAFKLQAGDTPVTITSLRVVSDSTTASEFRDIWVYKDGAALLGSQASLNNVSGSTRYAVFTFSPALTVPAGATTLLETSAPVTSLANGNMRLGLDAFQFSGTAPAVNTSLPIYGNNVPVGNTGTTTATFTATTTPAPCGSNTASVFISVQGTGGFVYTLQKNGVNFTSFTGSGTASDTVAIGATNIYELISGGVQIGSSKSVTGTQQSGCNGTTATLSVTTTPTSCFASPGTATVTVQGTSGVTYVVKRNNVDYATFVGSGSLTGTIGVGTTYTFTLWSNNSQIGNAQSVTGTQQTNCGNTTAGTLTVTTTPAACNATTATATITVQASTGTFTVKKNGSDFTTLTFNSANSSGGATDSVPIGTTNTYTLFSGGQQIGNAQSVTATRQSGCENTGGLTITTSDPLPEGTVGQRYSVSLSATGGTAPYTWSLVSGQFNLYPCCYTTLSTNGTFSSLDSAASIMPFSGTFQLPVRVTDSSGATSQKTLQFTMRALSTNPNPTVVNEGYIDALTSNNLSGWAYTSAAANAGRVPNITIVFENVSNTGLTYTLNTQPTGVRGDVNTYLKNKYGVTVTSATAFSANPASVIQTNGTYRIKINSDGTRAATFDGNPLVLSDSAKQNFTIGQGSSTTGPTGKYVKVDGDPTVYWVTTWGAKMPILSAQVFQSYGGRFEDIVVVSQEVLDAYEDVLYIKLQGNARVYRIDNGVKQYLTPAAATRLNVDPNKVVTVNSTEFYSYKTGATIQ